ncbi:carboxypeptidase-like regulatory domain-containing protein [Lutibacter sp. A64]|uniref:carboxypeptidase-like regulatory domain-containing protein n=1 Tax=Lutibacter sp. A64 TaxID=2918526 RepID=UPI001F05300F|nr:carboxypeptidase-like regulatory domain-containing protein [Lutibacter sp. A64]UMB54769.1 carboxypeptidase-like regulatory domain-containing protein [Lutibacter sp. A64]
MKFKNKLTALLLFLLCTSTQLFAQKSLVVIEGIVKSDSTFLESINVLNRTQQLGSASNAKGEFTLHAKLGDSILFSSINYKNRVIKISEKHINEKKILVYLEQNFNELDEVLLNQKIRLNFGNIDVQKGMILNTTENSKKKGPDLRRMTDPTYGNTGVDFISILSLITKGIRSKNKARKASELENQRLLEEFPTKLYTLYKADFFIDELKIPDHKIYLFLEYCQENGLSNHINSTEFQIKNFLIVQSRKFNKINE